MRGLFCAALLVSSAVTACGSDDGGEGGDGALAAPVVEGVMAMSPGLHVTWSNVQSDCEQIEGERKSSTHGYAVVFTVPGYVDNNHDSSATDPVEYTYRLRCRKGSEYSAYSNEVSATP